MCAVVSPTCYLISSLLFMNPQCTRCSRTQPYLTCAATCWSIGAAIHEGNSKSSLIFIGPISQVCFSGRLYLLRGTPLPLMGAIPAPVRVHGLCRRAEGGRREGPHQQGAGDRVTTKRPPSTLHPSPRARFQGQVEPEPSNPMGRVAKGRHSTM